MPPFLEHVCVDQVMVEVHTNPRQSPHERTMRVHALLARLDKLGFEPFFLEPNPVYPEFAREWSLVRRTPCVGRLSSGRILNR